ncbi:methylated-DNA--[protein]-cysteine S-methyltransferase [Gordonia amicalis]|uniref:Methylated-DNA--[protein]-cysteine S-methyltransferase n=1 Tax=Gordonia amicalis TaxID=89053 RepID=A0ABU4DGV6_9ACTN|nr:methylated-DNA--[protein]-cysteine S-methyltransferase [Gordonia amicalis]MDV6308477.1 methylated-DNA--[protein]-cysteine S-methyltransferase [Gordonia amicalis]MDV7100894.1 methylated-DNA--[protein]-cysteine S-methyltransferase [Gordonia amicalis]
MPAPSPTVTDGPTAHTTAADDPVTPGTATAAGYATLDTPNGPFTVIADDSERVLASGWTDDSAYLSALIHRSLRPESLQRSVTLGRLTDAVSAYYAGEVDAPSRVEVVQLSGGTFLNKAWDALRLVEPGRPVTYTEFAERAGEPAAIRAAATACARNAAALFVPCHRVKRSDGTLGGFRYGLDIKRWLLDFEAPAED